MVVDDAPLGRTVVLFGDSRVFGAAAVNRTGDQNLALNPNRTVRGNPGEMFVLLSAFRKYRRSNRFSTFAWSRIWRVSQMYAAASTRV
jgi:hypothetical protein